MKTILYIVFAGLVAILVLRVSDKREMVTSAIYVVCYEQYTAHNISADEFTKFMTKCMK